jgi:serine/threonine protein kinase
VPAKTAQREALLQTIEQKPHLGGRFEKIERIDQDGGGGQFSLVVRALDRHTQQGVALKFFDPTQRTDTYRWECFKREIDLLPGFHRKPDILQCVSGLTEFREEFTNPFGIIYGVDFAYYAVELADYDASMAIAGNRWSAGQKLEYFRAMCRAVQRIHRAYVAHRGEMLSTELVLN